MAKSDFKFVKVLDGIQLELSIEEAVALLILCKAVAGPKNSTARKYSESVADAIETIFKSLNIPDFGTELHKGTFEFKYMSDERIEEKITESLVCLK